MSQQPAPTAASPGAARPRNLIANVGEWNQELISQLEVVITDIEETTSDFTRKRNPKNRYWKAKVNFKQGNHQSRLLRMLGVTEIHGDVLGSARSGYSFTHAALKVGVHVAVAVVGRLNVGDFAAKHAEQARLVVPLLEVHLSLPVPVLGIALAREVTSRLRLKFDHLGVELGIEYNYRKIATRKCVLCDAHKTYDIRGPEVLCFRWLATVKTMYRGTYVHTAK